MFRLMLLALCVSVASIACDDGDGSGGSGSDPLATVTHAGGTIGTENWATALHVLQGSLTVSSGTLTVAPCSQILMPSGSEISVSDGGALNLVGTLDCPIVITSVNGATASPGDWNYLEFYASANNGANVLRHVHISYGGGSSYGSLWIDGGASVEISNSSVTHSGDVGIMVEPGGEVRAFESNMLTDNDGAGMQLGANEVGLLGGGIYGPNAVLGILVDDTIVDHDQTWLDLGTAFVAPTGFDVSTATGNARLTLAAGTTLLLGDSATVTVNDNGGLTLAGTPDDPILIDSAKGVPAAGDWNYIEVYEGSVDAYNDFDHVEIAHGGGSSYGAVWIDGGASVDITNCNIHDNADFAIMAETGAQLGNFFGNKLQNNDNGAIEIGANSVHYLGTGIYGPNNVEGIIVTDETIDHDATWLALVDEFTAVVPYVASSGFDISTLTGTAVLTVNPGAILALGPSAVISVGDLGGLTLAGDSTDHVTVTSAKSTAAAGDWNHIEIYGGSTNSNDFSYVDINYGGGSAYGQLWVDNGASVSLGNVVFGHAGGGCDLDAETGSSVDTSAGGNTLIACPQ